MKMDVPVDADITALSPEIGQWVRANNRFVGEVLDVYSKDTNRGDCRFIEVRWLEHDVDEWNLDIGPHLDILSLDDVILLRMKGKL